MGWEQGTEQSFYPHTVVVLSLSLVWTLFEPMGCSTPGFPVLHHLPLRLLKFMSIEYTLSGRYRVNALCIFWASLMAQIVKNPPAMRETRVPSLGWEDPLEKGMATHSRILAWRIPWTERLAGYKFVGSQRVRHDFRRTLLLNSFLLQVSEA